MDPEAREGNLQLVGLAGQDTVPEKLRPQMHLKRTVKEDQKVPPGSGVHLTDQKEADEKQQSKPE